MIKTLQNNPKQLFLIDGLGALLTIFFLTLVLTTYYEFIGMPKTTLYYLAFIVAIYAVYSFSCYFINPNKWQFLLKVIAFANLSYCIITIGCIYYFYENLTILGLAYFSLEILIIFILVILEFKIAS
ncbi:hypothetical protein [Aquimarina sp. SS2-1]|uniref:hypothetical protein n=1 Tax=Aquimarina besae TaxID=3342247 RepID=UPI00366CF70B